MAATSEVEQLARGEPAAPRIDPRRVARTVIASAVVAGWAAASYRIAAAMSGGLSVVFGALIGVAVFVGGIVVVLVGMREGEKKETGKWR